MSDTATDMVRVERDDIIRPDDEQVRAALNVITGTGDYSRLDDWHRAAHYVDACLSLGLNPRMRPFDWIEFYDSQTKTKKLTLYPNKSCTDQLAHLYRIRVRVVDEKVIGSLFKVGVEGTMPDGRTETNVAYVDLTDSDGKPLRGQKYGNALMKCHTKAKRRLILGMVGLMAPDLDDLKGARVAVVDGLGRYLEHPTEEERELASNPSLQQALQEPTYEETYAAHGGAAPLSGTPTQQPDLCTYCAPKAPYPRQTFRCDKKHWLGVWHMVVKDTFLQSDEARHDFVYWYTSAWPEDRRTNSLSTFLDRATDRQAEALVNRARETLAERASFAPAEADDPHEHDIDDESRPE